MVFTSIPFLTSHIIRFLCCTRQVDQDMQEARLAVSRDRTWPEPKLLYNQYLLLSLATLSNFPPPPPSSSNHYSTKNTMETYADTCHTRLWRRSLIHTTRPCMSAWSVQRSSISRSPYRSVRAALRCFNISFRCGGL